MPVYNSELYLKTAIDSILNQTFKDFEFIIINDGSTDKSLEIIKSYKDPRIKVHDLTTNHGIVYCLNKALEESTANIIARMDADDIALPSRLETQYQKLIDHPEYGMVSSRVQIIDERGTKGKIWIQGKTPEDIFYKLHFVNCIAHPSAMFRKELSTKAGLYRKEALHMEDYDLWYRFSKIAKIYEIPEILIQLRKSETNLSFKHNNIQIDNASDLTQNILSDLYGKIIDKHYINELTNNRIIDNNIKYDIELLDDINSKILKKESYIIKQLNLNSKLLQKSILSKKLIIIINFLRLSPIKNTLKNSIFVIKELINIIYNFSKLTLIK